MIINRKSSGFTIVELLIVIVVIAALALITIVVYINMSGRAAEATLQPDPINNSVLSTPKLALIQTLVYL